MTGFTQEQWQRNAEIEQMMRQMGEDRFNAMVAKAKTDGAEAGTGYGKSLLVRAVDAVAQAIETFKQEANSGKPGRRHIAVKYLNMIDSHTAGYIALKVAINSLHSSCLYQRLACGIGGKIEAEARLRKFEQEMKGYYGKIMDSLDPNSREEHRYKVLVAAMNRKGVEWESWSSQDKFHVGSKLLDLIIEVTGYVELVTHGDSVTDSPYILAPSPKAAEWIAGLNERSSVLAPVYMPTVIPPRDWVGPLSGAYHTPVLLNPQFIKTRNSAYVEELENRVDEMREVYDAVNTLQKTAWRVNTKVLEVMEELWERGGGLVKLPPVDDLPLPHKPVSLDLDKEARKRWSEEEKATWTAWKRKAHETHVANIKLRSRRLMVRKILWIADFFRNEEAIYFPYQLDFRGRIYAVPAFLNPQGPDCAKGLLEFSAGQPILDQEAADWLAIHGANVYGYDKVPMPERVKWVREHQDLIMASAEHPFDVDFWTEADKPWQFLAFCFEWTGFVRQGRGYVLRLPIAMDGSCNGLQIFSLILRDPEGGRHVNLVPSFKPADIYQVVASKVVCELERIAAEGGEEAELAQQWLDFGITRKTTKRSVMIVPYSGTIRACREYIEEHVHEREEAAQEKAKAAIAIHPWGDKLLQPTNFLSKLVWKHINETIPAARACMDWLQKVARIAASEGLPVTWTTPAGFPVLQAYKDVRKRRVKTKLGDSFTYFTLQEDLDTIDKRKQASGISPNFVHALDAAALMKSVLKAAGEGITEFAMIHDSYGIPAGQAVAMARCLREAFVEMFSTHDVLAEFLESVVALVSPDKVGEIPPMPQPGSLDINLVKQSVFFFA